jgi:hypothetical protein
MNDLAKNESNYLLTKQKRRVRDQARFMMKLYKTFFVNDKFVEHFVSITIFYHGQITFPYQSVITIAILQNLRF